jgi:hypothetical protein
MSQDIHQGIALPGTARLPPGVRQLVHGCFVLVAAQDDQGTIADPVAAAHRLVQGANFEA